MSDYLKVIRRMQRSNLSCEEAHLKMYKLESQLKEKDERLALADIVIEDLSDLINSSYGVAELHKNSEVASWDWLISNGWLTNFKDYQQAIKEDA